MRTCILRGLVFIVLLFNSTFCGISRAALQGGCARVNITPPLGITLIGSQSKPSDSVMDDLYAKAMVLSDARTTVAIVSIDLLYTSLDEITDPVRDIVHQQLGIPRTQIRRLRCRGYL